MTDPNPPQDSTPPPENEQDDLSIAGQGWDILVGGRGNLEESGGDNPFDLEEAPAAAPPPAEGATVIEMRALADIAAEGPKTASPADFSEKELAEMEMASPAPPQLLTTQGLPDLSPDQLESMTDEALEQASKPLQTSIGEDVGARPIADEMTNDTDLDLDALTREPTVSSDMPPEGDKVATLFDQLNETGAPPPSKADLMGASPAPPPAPRGALRALNIAGPDDLLSGKREIPLSGAGRSSPPKEGALVPDEEIAGMLVTPERIGKLWAEIDALYETVIEDVRGDYRGTEQSLADLQYARELLLAGRDYFDDAEEVVMAVRARLRLEEKVQDWSRKYGTLIGVYLVIWLLGMSAFSLFIAPLEAIITTQYGVTEFLAGTILPGLFGGLGGVVGAIWVLIKHTAKKRNFDPLHRSWYFFNPLLGVALGVLTYILSYGGGLLFNIGTAGGGTFDPSESAVVYGICAIVGFRQNVFWNLIERIAGGIFGSDDDDEEGA